jgi:hypothetical protein
LAALQQKDLEALSEMPAPFFDTKQEGTMRVLTHRPNSDGRPRYDGKVSHLIGFSSSLYGMLDGQFLEMKMNMLGRELKAHLMREASKEKYSTTPEWVQAVKREVDEVLPTTRLADDFEEKERMDYLAAILAEGSDDFECMKQARIVAGCLKRIQAARYDVFLSMNDMENASIKDFARRCSQMTKNFDKTKPNTRSLASSRTWERGRLPANRYQRSRGVETSRTNPNCVTLP